MDTLKQVVNLLPSPCMPLSFSVRLQGSLTHVRATLRARCRARVAACPVAELEQICAPSRVVTNRPCLFLMGSCFLPPLPLPFPLPFLVHMWERF